MMFEPSSICGVTSRATPEKNGLKVSVGNVVDAPAVITPVPVDDPPAILVRKNSSVPTLRTAFWLFMVAMRGLDRTWTRPCVSRNCRRAAKFFVWNASPSREPPGVPESRVPVVPLVAKLAPARLAAIAPAELGDPEADERGPVVPSVVFGFNWPPPALRFVENSAQLTPAWNCSLR